MIKIDTNKCIGCSACVSIDPQTFELNEATFKAKIISQKTTPRTKSAADSCPVGAISIK